MNGMVSIPQDLYLELIKDQEELYAFYAFGVMEWPGYEMAMDHLDDMGDDE